jgi:hypothetical protein
MTELRTRTHSLLGCTIVEVWEDSQLIAHIYPKDRGLKIISKYLDNRRPGLVTFDASPTTAIHVNIWTGRPANSHQPPSP